MSLYTDIRDSGGDLPPQEYAEDRYVERYPDQRQDIIGYAMQVDDLEGFRADLEKALDEEKRIVFGPPHPTQLDAVPSYKIE